MTGKKRKMVTRYRSAVDGQFVKKSEANKRPREHIKQRISLAKRRRRHR